MHSLAFAVVALAAIEVTSAIPIEGLPHNDFFAQTQACIPNKKFVDVCNECTCLPSGTQASCSETYCMPPEKPRIDGFLIEDGLVCPPEQKFFDMDIECTCSEDGKTASCGSDMFMDVSAVPEEDHPHNDFFAKTQVCIPNEKFVQVCNDCTCHPSGKQASCSKMYCKPPEKPRIDGFLTADGLACAPGRKFFDVDIECTCSDDGKTASCGPNMITHSSAEPGEDHPRNDFFKQTQLCIPNKKFIDVCNDCTCLPSGKQASCSKMYCYPPVKPRIDGFLFENGLACPPGQKFNDIDIECTCSEDGKTASCGSEIFTEVSAVPEEDLPHNDFFTQTQVCIPNEKFLNVCNECVCLPSGKQAVCSKMYCMPPEKPRIDGFAARNGLFCPPGQKFFDNNIECTCSEDGKTASCGTYVIRSAPKVSAQNYPHNDFFGETKVCNPGRIFFDKCNLCTCNTSGNAADCTKMYCRPPVKPRIDGFIGNKGLVCLPGKKFYDNDVRCICSKTGRNAKCNAALENLLDGAFGVFHL